MTIRCSSNVVMALITPTSKHKVLYIHSVNFYYFVVIKNRAIYTVFVPAPISTPVRIKNKVFITTITFRPLNKKLAYLRFDIIRLLSGRDSIFTFNFFKGPSIMNSRPYRISLLWYLLHELHIIFYLTRIHSHYPVSRVFVSDRHFKKVGDVA